MSTPLKHSGCKMIFLHFLLLKGATNISGARLKPRATKPNRDDLGEGYNLVWYQVYDSVPRGELEAGQACGTALHPPTQRGLPHVINVFSNPPLKGPSSSPPHINKYLVSTIFFNYLKELYLVCHVLGIFISSLQLVLEGTASSSSQSSFSGLT